MILSAPARGRFRAALLPTLLLAASGCGAGEGVPVGGASESGEVSSLDDPVLSSDPGLREQAAALVPSLAEAAGLPLREPVRVERRTRDELLVHVQERLDRELPADQSRLTVEAYALLGLVPPGLELRELLAEVYREQVAGFYDPGSRALYVLDDQPASALEPLLLHELVHAIQDQHVPLDSLTAPRLGNDRRAAARAAIEGHATLVMLAWMARGREGRPVEPEDLPGLADALRPDDAALALQYPALAAAPRVLREGLLFPYAQGAAFVQALWRGVPGRPPPFGGHLPHSTEQVMELGAGGDPPVEVVVSVPDGVRVLLENTLGALETGVFVSELDGGGLSEAVRGWGGDRWALVESPDGGRGLLWVTVWDSAADRDRFVSRVEPHLPRLPTRARLRAGEVDGRAAAILRLGEAPDVERAKGDGP